MSHFHRQDVKLEEQEEADDRPRSPFADVAGRFANWVAGVDRLPEREPLPDGQDPFQALAAGVPEEDDDAAQHSSRFPVARFGYDRMAVDEHLAGLERELSELRARVEPPMSVTEELERIGEQTASILVVAHDKATETTRRAQEQAERCIADAAANAVAITEEAKARLRELDNETDLVWRERERLLEDVRAVSSALASLADQASDRFPAAADQTATTAFPMAAAASAAQRRRTGVFGRQETVAFSAADAAEAIGEIPFETEDEDEAVQPSGDPGDTASWLAGFEPPEDPARDA